MADHEACYLCSVCSLKSNDCTISLNRFLCSTTNQKKEAAKIWRKKKIFLILQRNSPLGELTPRANNKKKILLQLTLL